MPKNIGLGGKNKKKGKKMVTTERELSFKEEGEDYAQVIRPAGDSRFEVLCGDGKKRFGHVAGKLRKRVFINVNDIVLVTISEFEDDKCYIVLKYTEDEVRKLRKAKEIPDNFNKTSEENEKKDDDLKLSDDDDDFFVFEKKEKISKKSKVKEETVEDEEDENNEDEENEDEEGENEEEEKDNDIEDEDGNNNEDEEEEEEDEEEEVETKFSKGKFNKTKRQQGNDRKKDIDDL